MNNCLPEIRREKIFIPPKMTTQQIKQEYALTSRRGADAKRKGFFVKNYSRKQVIIDPENFDTANPSVGSMIFFRPVTWFPFSSAVPVCHSS